MGAHDDMYILFSTQGSDAPFGGMKSELEAPQPSTGARNLAASSCRGRYSYSQLSAEGEHVLEYPGKVPTCVMGIFLFNGNVCARAARHLHAINMCSAQGS